jgi:hypothetical protein
MSSETLAPPSLFDLMGRSWQLPGAVGEAVFSHDGSTVAFAGGGTLAIARLADPERPATRMRLAADSGRRTILPRQKPVRPATEVRRIAGPLVVYGKESFLGVAEDGGLVYVSPRGQAVPLRVRPGAPVAALARDPCSEAIALGAGGRVLILPNDAPEDPAVIEVGEPVSALAFAPDGRRLAVGHARGVSFVAHGRLGAGVALDSAPQHLSFSPDGAWLACGLTEPGFALIDPEALCGEVVADYPIPVRSFAWSRAAGALATSGAFRTVAWALTEHGFGDALEAGRNGLVIVERVAASPDQPLVAAGYANGLLCISRIGARDEMMLRATGGAVSALVWGPDGAHLALGDADGNAALLAFPPGIFK